ncbi:MAG: response regulator [Planctomycetes bacterium]|nr:response regulator [Planctomycetota bacterium]
MPEMNTPAPTDVPAILVVDDSQLEQRFVAKLLETQGGWRILFARNGIEALAVLAREIPSVVLTDIQMPQMDGLTLVEKIRDQFPQVPVVLMTGDGSERIAVEALKAGAADYVPKQALTHDLASVLERVLSIRQAETKRFRVLAGLTRRSSQFLLENDPSLVPPLVALLRDDMIEIGLCDITGATRAGIALEESLLNAMYHGNLEVSSDLRENGDEAFHKLAAERRFLEPYQARRVRVNARMIPGRATFVIADQGPGFDITKLPDPDSPEYIPGPSGRGILLMRAFMSEVRYNSTGNQVTLVKTGDRGGKAD